MRALTRHLQRSFVAGVVALLPVGGTVLMVVYLESSVARSWLAEQPFYFPGLGLLLAAAIIYLVGLTVSTFLGRWVWGRVDRTLDRLPALGQLYQTLKQLFGYGEGSEAVFKEVVLLRPPGQRTEEIGLVTNRLAHAGDQELLVVFVPGAPNPTSGRMLFVPAGLARTVDVAVSDVLRTLVSVGTVPLPVPVHPERSPEPPGRVTAIAEPPPGENSGIGQDLSRPPNDAERSEIGRDS
jgi:uncharacterized membrane protein